MSLRIFNLKKKIYSVICNLINAFLSRTTNYVSFLSLCFLIYLMDRIIAIKQDQSLKRFKEIFVNFSNCSPTATSWPNRTKERGVYLLKDRKRELAG